jgi:hypothetical protein
MSKRSYHLIDARQFLKKFSNLTAEGTDSIVFEDTIAEDPEPDPDPQDPHFFGPPGCGSISQRCGSRIWLRIRILPFSHKYVERTEIMPAK